MTELHWVNGPWLGRLALSARPRGGDWLKDEMQGWKAAGIDTVVSLLEEQEWEDLDLANEAVEANRQGLHFESIPIADRSVPESRASFTQRLDRLERELQSGRNLALHCRQGIGRTGLVAACLLMLEGLSPDGAVKILSCARGLPVPETEEQRGWLDSFAESLVVAG